MIIKNTITGLMLFLMMAIAHATTFSYQLALDANNTPQTGCVLQMNDALPTQATGVDYLVNVYAQNDTSPSTVEKITLQSCQAGVFNAETTINVGSWLVGTESFNNIIELSVLTEQLGNPGIITVVGTFVKTSGGSYGLLARQQIAPIDPGNPPNNGARSIPTLSNIMLVIMALSLFVLVMALQRWFPAYKSTLSVVLMLVIAGLSNSNIAQTVTTIILDGKTNDWSGIAPLQTVQVGDSSAATPAQQLKTLYAVLIQQSLYFRIDVQGGYSTQTPTNTPPIANAGADTTVTVGSTVTLDASQSSDVDQDTLSYFWILSSPAGSTAILSDPVNIKPTFVADKQGDYQITLNVNDGIEDSNTDVVIITATNTGEMPPDPTSIAPTLSANFIPSFFDSISFIYSGDNPVQFGVVDGVINPVQAAILRGRVLDRSGNPMPGVKITIDDHQEYGYTFSRNDGYFDLVVNGGPILCLRYNLSGYLVSQRKLKVLREDYTMAPDVVLVPVDSAANSISMTPSTEVQVIRGSQTQDSDGKRQATLIVPKGTQAMMRMPSGQAAPFTRDLVIRATEYTVGENGPQAMPGNLPPTSAYTYAVELSVDEALKSGASSVEFDKPLPFYVENFLNFPVGTIVPMGYYDRVKAIWVPSKNGRVIAILSESNGTVNLDIDGDGQADNTTALQSLGITNDELVKLASLYEPGQSLWRVPITHFTPWDCNWPRTPSNGAKQPDVPDPENDPQVDETPESEEDNTACGSIIDCQNQVLREQIDVVGTSYSLSYTSKRAAGRNANDLKIPLSGNTLPPGVRRIDLEIEVLGRRITRTFVPANNLSSTFSWDNLDVFERPRQGTQIAKIRVGYVYDAVYAEPGDFEQSFATLSGVPITGNRAREQITLWKDSSARIGAWKSMDNQHSNVQSGIGGWSLNTHHA
ncbi:MAG: PKD domain-containing protein, partial [Gammaproteobacteria bacterium]|nr:PKD domain-containing protein [Gammaproteobacteria bacterium]